MAKLKQTSEAVMGLIFIVMNLEKWLQKYFGLFLPHAASYEGP